MGKYMKKPKVTGDTVSITITDMSLGVRTRAKTLALQKLEALKTSTDQQHSESCYLQLRSRRLQKPLLVEPRNVCSSGGCCSVGSDQTRIKGGGDIQKGYFDLDFGGRERSTRESTPCSSIKEFNVISTPSNSRSMPLSREIEEFFAVHEQEQHKRFAEKYNFSFVDEKPLEGCYEWVKVESQ